MVFSPDLLPPALCCIAQEEMQEVNSLLDLARRSIGDQERIAASHGETESVEAAGDSHWLCGQGQRKGGRYIREVAEDSEVGMDHVNCLHFLSPVW